MDTENSDQALEDFKMTVCQLADERGIGFEGLIAVALTLVCANMVTTMGASAKARRLTHKLLDGYLETRRHGVEASTF